MILKMSALTLLYVLLTMLVWKITRNRKMGIPGRIFIGVLYGICSVLSTHFGVDHGEMLLNVRDMGPLSAGLFFHPLSGVIAGVIGGVERYIAGTYWNIGSYTRIACSVSTCLAGLLTVILYYFIFKKKIPSPVFAFFMGAVMEVFHMYVIFITHRDDMNMAYYVVRNCAGPMILFTGIGMGLSSFALMLISGQRKSLFNFGPNAKPELSSRFRIRLFAVIMVVFVLNFIFSYAIQTQSAIQNGRSILASDSAEIAGAYAYIQDLKGHLNADVDPAGLDDTLSTMSVGRDGSFDIISNDGSISVGKHANSEIQDSDLLLLQEQDDGSFFRSDLFGISSLCMKTTLNDGETLLVQLPLGELYADRDAAIMEMAFADILLMSSIFVLISILVQMIVVDDLTEVIGSLNKITDGDLNEVVSVRNSQEFDKLSDDINETVVALKGYIDAAEKRMEQELIYARTIQESALPRNFTFPRDDFEIFALMDPAREVGGDFYDFFFVDVNKMVMVIADVSGKGIPAALFMMRSKTTIRTLAEEGLSPSEIFFRANNALCEGNDADMFVTVWLAIIDLETGHMVCANAGHEYPAVMRAGGEYELLKDKHSLALAAMPEVRTRKYDLQMSPGDSLFVYTDGVTEAINERTEEYGMDRMLRKLNLERSVPIDHLLPSVRADISTFAGTAEQFDDITMLGFLYKGPKKGAFTKTSES